MRLAIINDELDQDLDRAVSAAVELGFAGLEIRSVWDRPPHLLDDAQLGRVAATLADANLATAGFCPPAMKCALPSSDAEIEDVRALVQDSVRRARLVGSPTMRIFSFFREGDPDPRRAAKAAREVLDGIDWQGVEPILENGTRTNTPTIRDLLVFLDELDEGTTGILWDPGNSVFSGWEAKPFPQDYLAGRERIRHVHVKDPDGRNGYVRLGDGDLPWAGILTALAEDGYDGWVSLETHWRIGRVLTASQRDEPWGEEFSSGGFESSTECMRRLSTLVGEIAGVHA